MDLVNLVSRRAVLTQHPMGELGVDSRAQDHGFGLNFRWLVGLVASVVCGADRASAVAGGVTDEATKRPVSSITLIEGLVNFSSSGCYESFT